MKENQISQNIKKDLYTYKDGGKRKTSKMRSHKVTCEIEIESFYEM